MNLRRPAQAFVIWRFCVACDWQTTYAEVAEETGVPLWHVSRIVRERGWEGRFQHVRDDYRFAPLLPVDTAMRMPNAAMGGSHLV